MPWTLPHITILMGTRNGGAYLRQQLASIAAQDHRNWSLWISDDGSTDATRGIVHTFAKAQPNPVVLLPGPCKGASANYLGLLCHPDLPPGPVAFADQDDLWLPGHLSRGLRGLARVDTGTRGHAYVAGRLPVSERLSPRPLEVTQTHPPSFANALVENILTGNTLILDPHAVALARSMGVADVPFWDWWLYLVLTGLDVPVMQDARPGLFYRAHDNAQLGPRSGLTARLWRLRRVVDGSYRRWHSANMHALEPHINALSPAAQQQLKALLALPEKRRLRQLSAYRRRQQDRLALWLMA